MPPPAHMDDALLLSPLALSAPAAPHGFHQPAISDPYFTSFAANAPMSFQPFSYPSASALARSESESSSSSSTSSSGSFFCGVPASTNFYEPDNLNGQPPSSPTTIVFSSPSQDDGRYTDLPEMPPTPSRIARALSAALPSSSSGMPVQSYPNVAASSARPPRRRTLTHAEKHLIWKHARDHPNDSQKKIGKVFGVERSTVSKICKALNKSMEVRNNSGSRQQIASGNTSSGKFRHIESRLADWIRSLTAEGHVVRDDEIREQALLIAAGTDRRDELVNGFKASATWMEKFKQRHRECFTSTIRSAGSVHTRSRTKADEATTQDFGESDSVKEDLDDDDDDDDEPYSASSASSTSSTMFHLEVLPAQAPTPIIDGYYPVPTTMAEVDLSLQYTPYSTSAASTFSSISPQSSPELLTPISGSFPSLEYQATNAPLLPDISEQCGETYFGMPTADPVYAQGLISPDYFSADTFRTL
ncbi:hypothetical protein LIPSTDRAFT_1714 [Lipomyces starkeyi NRRL Y-11557]|uniref:HTH CENPB-type domain-containing protein n=1 Tax=Lipomyces starkeyi NRRL Y-11557 TaxID=675824 RepID=A0A1E3QB98_LIPST|nr:hypothetical protein LIPSTDRAFT_1714 [Lipomyces starkeyi NRRL Y-11557]